MSMKDIKKIDTKDLHKLVTDKRVELRTFRFSASGSAVKNVKQARNTRKEIARAMTELRSRSK